MVKIFMHLHRAGGSLDEFQAHWLEYHTQLALRIRPMRRYVQYHTLPDILCQKVIPQAGLLEEPFDGVAVGWHDSRETMQASMQNDPDTIEGLKDMAFFIDLDRMVITLTEERVIVEPEGRAPYVLIGGLRCYPGMDRIQFQEAWLKHAAMKDSEYAAQGKVSGYIQNLTLPDEAGKVEEVGAALEPFDGIVMYYFESIMLFRAFAASPLAQESFEKEKEFIDHSRSVYMMTQRHVIKELVR